MKNKVLLSFDIEEFDMPRERGGEITVEEGAKVSAEGLKKILKLLKNHNVRATFFTTGNFAKYQPELTRKIVKDGHELACHGVDHFEPKKTDICESKKILEKISKKKINGYRQPRMFKIDYDELSKCGYKYDSSVNPAFIPGRYNHLKTPRKPYKCGKIIEVPVSVASRFRVPLFWLSLHLFPVAIYKKLVRKAMKETGYFATYFHPWEFAEINSFKKVPSYIKKNSGDKLVERLEKVIIELKDYDFVTFEEFAEVL